ncbi:conserved hypothetical protein [Halorhabdus utahensis DSM 12940]|uniref:Lipoprotein n=1 Tax=Halorhabdus utahensis (strain DSM 12940 / JCM 11049 / AX-2) TaxID=519442 RepID=C7NQL6_HALUD|nr:DUF5803 family protein [Halorhabdus utahensis]ACV10475.1 conserved hypothetical protein [Halorhabdus utahensis DSM 12940]
MNSRTRFVFGVVGLLGLLALAGCLSPVSDADLAENATYDWDTEANATYRLYAGNYTAVVEIQDQASLELFLEDGLGSEQPIPISGLKFQYPNGTVGNDSVYSVSTGRSKVVLEPPVENGTVAFTARRSGSTFRTRTLVAGSHEVALSPNKRVGLPVVSRVVPGGYETERSGDRVLLQWDTIERNTISIKTYLERDLVLFGGLVGIVSVVAVIGLAYYRREIAKVRRQRQELGLDVEGETDDDDPRDRGPPPGMK